MSILGFNCHAHNAAACLLQDGRVVAAAEEERFSRVKHDGRLPRHAIAYCLAEAGLRIADVDHVAFHWQPFLGFGRRLLQVASQLRFADRMAVSHAGTWWNLLNARRDFAALAASLGGAGAARPRYRFHRVPHHHAHAASAFFGSPFEEAAVIVIDGTGEIASTSLALARGRRIEVLRQVEYPHSMGYLFVALTHYLGFRPESDEYKLMALASYGEDTFVDAFQDIVRLTEDGGFAVDLSYTNYQRGVRDPWFSPRFTERFGPLRRAGEPVEPRHAAIARGLQRRLEDVALHMARHLADRTGARALCLAGGVALNAVMNGRLVREGPFEDVFVQPAAGDAGCCLGSAWYVHNVVLGGERQPPPPDVYLGPHFSLDACRSALAEAGLSPRVLEEEALLEEVADHLAAGRVVGWFQGRAEMGPRALGNRSILADPRQPDMQDILNRKVKHREEFRPFAPSVPEEAAVDWFECRPPLPHMTVVVPVRPAARATLPAITHVDGSARIQTVRRDTNPRYWGLLRAFERRTGVPVLVNTSFNVMGEPIVCTPADAIRCFQATDIDVLVLDRCLARKPGVTPAPVDDGLGNESPMG
jgi:carbamoyltransferase